VLSGGVLPVALQRALGRAHGDGAIADLRGRRWELAARLDLRDPLVRAVWARVRANPASAAALSALGRTLRDRAHLDARTYRLDSSASGGGAGLGAGIRIAGEYDHSVDRARLLAAASRPPAGLWERRLDCVPA
jgi:hypothetical protein